MITNHERGQYGWEGLSLDMGQPAGQPIVDSYRRYNWGQVNPAPGVYDWSVIDADLERVAAQGGMMGLRIMPLDFSSRLKNDALPAFIRDAESTWEYEAYGETWKIPDWNDELYVSSWEALSKAFGERYDDHPTISYVDLSGIGHYGEGHDHPYGAGYPGPLGQVSISEENAKRVLKSQIDSFPTMLLTYNLTTFLYSDKQRFLEQESSRLLLWALAQSPRIGLRYDCIGGGQTQGGAWLMMDRAQAFAEAENVPRDQQPAHRWEIAPFVSEWCANVAPAAEVPAGSVAHGTVKQGLEQVRDRHISLVSSHNYRHSWEGSMDQFFSPEEVTDFQAASAAAGYAYSWTLVKDDRGGVSAEWVNNGSAPIYRKTTVAYHREGQPDIVSELDLRKVLPGQVVRDPLPLDAYGLFTATVTAEKIGVVNLPAYQGLYEKAAEIPVEVPTGVQMEWVNSLYEHDYAPDELHPRFTPRNEARGVTLYHPDMPAVAITVNVGPGLVQALAEGWVMKRQRDQTLRVWIDD